MLYFGTEFFSNVEKEVIKFVSNFGGVRDKAVVLQINSILLFLMPVQQCIYSFPNLLGIFEILSEKILIVVSHTDPFEFIDLVSV